MKQFRCKHCYCQYDFRKKTTFKKILKLKNTKIGKYLLLTCPQCGYKRKVIFGAPVKTKFEKLLLTEKPSRLNDQKIKQV